MDFGPDIKKMRRYEGEKVGGLQRGSWEGKKVRRLEAD
jgi:hypothetical protein